MPRSATLRLAVTWALPFASSALSLSMKRTKVNMNFDGHMIKLLVDTGSDFSYLVYGGWYESLYGPGSCKYLISGCYFCPPTDPCDLDTLLAQRVDEQLYGGGDVNKFVSRKVNVKVGKRKIENLTIGLMVGSTRILKNKQPLAALGLSFASKALRAAGKVSFLEQLLSSTEPTVSVHVSKRYLGITGKLVLGESTKQTEGTAVLPLEEVSWAGTMNAMVAAAVWLKGPSDTDRMTTLLSRERHFNIVLDTGAEISIVPKELFSMLWEAIAVEFGPDHVARANEAYSTDDPTLAAYIDATGLICFRRSFTERLPVIGIQVADASTLEIRLSNHVQVCDEVWCRLQVKGQLIVDESRDFFILSNHFFADYQVSLDFGRKLIGLRAPRRPVTRKTSTVKSWNKRNGPPCRRVVQRRTGIAWLVRNCIGEPEDD